MLRVFIAVPIPTDLHPILALKQGGISGASWVPPENFHITLAFPGEIDENDAQELDDILQSIQMHGFSLSLEGAGAFEHLDKISHVYIGVTSSKPLLTLRDKICAQLDIKGISYYKRKRYVPHVTLARMKSKDANGAAGFIQEHSLFKSDSFHVTEFVLYQSYLGKNGSKYVPLKRYPLQTL